MFGFWSVDFLETGVEFWKGWYWKLGWKLAAKFRARQHGNQRLISSLEKVTVIQLYVSVVIYNLIYNIDIFCFAPILFFLQSLSAAWAVIWSDEALVISSGWVTGVTQSIMTAETTVMWGSHSEGELHLWTDNANVVSHGSLQPTKALHGFV